MFVDYYKLLGVLPQASPDEIKVAYRRLTKKFHPDVNADDTFYEETFKDIQEAHNVLSVADTRKRYDAAYRQFLKNPDSAEAHMRKFLKPLQGRGDRPLISKKLSLVVGATAVLLSVVVAASIFRGKNNSNVAATGEEYLQIPASEPREIKPVLADTEPASAAVTPSKLVSIPAEAPRKERVKALPRIARHPQASTGLVAEVTEVRKPAPLALLPSNFKPVVASPPPARGKSADTEIATDKILVPPDLQYGYIVILIKRTIHYNTSGKSESFLIPYITQVVPYGPVPPARRAKALFEAEQLCRLNESKSALSTPEMVSHINVVSRELKTFKLQTAAFTSYSREKKAIHLVGLGYY